MKAHRVEYSSFQAKAHLSEILRQVEAGEPVTITRRGKRIALLIPYAKSHRDGQLRILQRFREIRLKIGSKGSVSIKELVSEGRKG